jgi:predicted GNAT superfamily acetyltransferase
MPTLRIRPLKTLDDFRACERIQKSAWGNVGVASEVLKVTAKYGGVVLGAAVNGKVVGFLYAFLARRHGRPIHWSHLMAVEPGFRDRGLGFRMKLAHRRLALAQGIKSVCWTYDPLQSRNAALNIARLGGRVDEYLENCYGRFESRIERGLPSDRLVVDWRIASVNVARRLAVPRRCLSGIASLPRVNETRTSAGGFIENRRLHLALTAPRLAVEIPANTDTMRARNLRLAERWRRESRRIFQRYFARGYDVEDFVPPGAPTGGRCFYILRRGRAKS